MFLQAIFLQRLGLYFNDRCKCYVVISKQVTHELMIFCLQSEKPHSYPRREVSLEAHVYAQPRKSKYAIAYSEYAAAYSKVDESRLLALIDFAQQAGP